MKYHLSRWLLFGQHELFSSFGFDAAKMFTQIFPLYTLYEVFNCCVIAFALFSTSILP